MIAVDDCTEGCDDKNMTEWHVGDVGGTMSTDFSGYIIYIYANWTEVIENNIF